MTLDHLATLLSRYADGAISLTELQAAFAPVLASDALGAEAGDDRPWAEDHDRERLFWRLLYVFDTVLEDGPALRGRAARVVRCLADTRSPADTFELLPLLLDEERFRTIVLRHRAGIISRTGFLNVIAESGYPAHVKLWLEHASPAALGVLVERLAAGHYAQAARAFEQAPE